MTVTRSQTVDIGGGRGRLIPAAAASLRRVNRNLGRLTDVNSAWRDPALQQELRDAYLRYLNGGPWAPIALDPDDSLHCEGRAIDTDDGYDARTHAILNEHGWRLTVYRWVNGVRKLVEPWHREYFPDRDQHRNDPPPSVGGNLPPLPEGHTMTDVRQIHWKKKDGKVGGRALIVPGTAWAVPFIESGTVYANRLMNGLDTGGSIELTQSLFNAVITAAARCAPTSLTINTVDADQ